jgi:large subunit ribosomal protein L10
MKRHTKKWKQDSLAEIKKLAKEYKTIALADIKSFPADLFQKIRKKLKGKAIVKVTKTRIVQRMLDETQYKDSELKGFAQNMCAVIFTNLDPFELFALVKKNKGKTAAKAGQTAPLDIVVPAGDTGLPPGPALTDLKNAGLKVKLQGPTIQVSEDKIVAKKGETISQAVASVLSKLNIRPISVGLNITAVMQGKTLYLAEVLNIDEEEVFNNFRTAYLNAIGLAMEIGYSTPETVKLMIQKAFRESEAIALKAKVSVPEGTKELEKQADAVAKEATEETKKTSN